MNNEIILQNLCDAFEVLKDSWESKREAIINCIVETEIYDGDTAMDMWAYILQKNSILLEDKEGVMHLIDEVLDSFHVKYEGTSIHHNIYACRAILHHVSSHLSKNERLIKLIFGKSLNAGYKIDKWGGIYEYIPMCIAGILLQGNCQIVELLIKSLAENSLIKDISIGELFLKANKYLNLIYRGEDDLGIKYAMEPNVKDTLINSLNYFRDKNERAECTIAFLSM